MNPADTTTAREALAKRLQHQIPFADGGMAFVSTSLLREVIAALASPLTGAGEWRIPQGWQLVPIEPTPEMTVAGDVGLALGANAWRTWERMLDAAPPPARDSGAER